MKGTLRAGGDFGKGFSEKWYLSCVLDDKEPIMQSLGEEAFQEEGTASTEEELR